MDDRKREATLAALKEQEETLIFDKFDESDAWIIGTRIREKILSYGGAAAIDITCGKMCLFSCCVSKLTPHNLTWIPRKRNTVLEFWQSSYRVSLNLQKMGKTLEERGLPSIDYAVSGGGFPIYLRSFGVVGAITVSGMDQTMDHQFIADVVAEYLDKRIPSIL